MLLLSTPKFCPAVSHDCESRSTVVHEPVIPVWQTRCQSTCTRLALVVYCIFHSLSIHSRQAGLGVAASQRSAAANAALQTLPKHSEDRVASVNQICFNLVLVVLRMCFAIMFQLILLIAAI